jgi:hypothetical protein
MRVSVPALLVLGLVAGCATPGERKPAALPPAPVAPGPLTGAAAVEAMKAASAALLAKAEHDSQRIQVQHLLVSFEGAPRVDPQPQRSKEAAETLAAELYARVVAGEDFAALIREHTDDNYPGIYALTLGAPKKRGEWPRGDMVAAFGDTGWRLAVGEVGVALYDPMKSPFGWHIVKRTR